MSDYSEKEEPLLIINQSVFPFNDPEETICDDLISAVDSSEVSSVSDHRERSSPEHDHPLVVHEVAGPFLSAEELNIKVSALAEGMSFILDRIEKPILGELLPGLAFDNTRKGPDDKVVCVKADQIYERDIWFIGDLHADLLAFEAALRFIKSEDKKSAAQNGSLVILLGDISDGDYFNIEVTLRLLELLCERPGRVCILSGNHDAGLYYNGSILSSRVEPAQLARELNLKDKENPVFHRLGILIVELFRKLPCALFFPDGLLAVHGGFPHKDLWEGIHTVADLNADSCISDFIWTRSSSLPRKKPNRHSSGSQYGYKDFMDFCAKASEILPKPVSRMIRGHDHHEKRYELNTTKCSNGVLTINTMSYRLSREFSEKQTMAPCIAKYQPGLLPEVYCLQLPTETVSQVYPPLVES